MDYLTFIATVIGHLAWPVVIAALLYYLRAELTGLAQRLKELTLPGGMKATFEQELEVAKSITEQIPVEAIALPSQTDLAENAQISGLAAHYPPAAILLAYNEVENKLREISRRLGQKYPNMQRTLQTLIERNTLDSEASALFQSLKRARNSAAHGDIESSTVSRIDAIEYASQATFLIRLLDEATRKL